MLYLLIFFVVVVVHLYSVKNTMASGFLYFLDCTALVKACHPLIEVQC